MEIKKGEIVSLDKIEELEKNGYHIIVGVAEDMNIEAEKALQKSAQGEMTVKYKIEAIDGKTIIVDREFI